MSRCVPGSSIFEKPSDASCEKAPLAEHEVKGAHPLAQWFVGRREAVIYDGFEGPAELGGLGGAERTGAEERCAVISVWIRG